LSLDHYEAEDAITSHCSVIMTQEASDAADNQQIQEALVPYCEVESDEAVEKDDGAPSTRNDSETQCPENESHDSRNQFEVR